MKLSQSTIKVLSAFSQINSSINFEPGNVIKIKNESNSFVASAEVVDEFPRAFCIYGLPAFIQALKLFDEVDIEFNESNMKIKNAKGSGSIQYSYTSPALIAKVDYSKKLKSGVDLASFILTNETLRQIQKSSAMFGSVNILIQSVSDSVVNLGTTTIAAAQKDTENSFNIDVESEYEMGESFSVALDNNILKLYTDTDYRVTISKTNEKLSIVKFTSLDDNDSEIKLEYITSAKNV